MLDRKDQSLYYAGALFNYFFSWVRSPGVTGK
jgi:hypothetical protein